MNAIFRLSERAVVDIRVDNVKRPWRLDLEDGDPCYLPLPLPEQTVAMTVRQQAAKAMADAVYLTDPSDFEVTVGDSRFVFTASSR